MNFLAIDPGLGGTGVACFAPDQNHPIDYTSFAATLPEQSGILEMTTKLYQAIREFEEHGPIQKVYMEWPIWMGANVTAKSGDLITLAALAGAYMKTITTSNQLMFQPVPVRDWKGDAPKYATVGWIQYALKIEDDGHFPNSHVWDAVGIGLWVKGLI